MWDNRVWESRDATTLTYVSRTCRFPLAMASRLRLFVKKRGTRRTGARWPGLLAEGALFAALLAIGVYALYWLIVKVLLDEQATYGWWPWLAMVIPLGLIVVGGTNLVLLLWQNTASTERRAAVAAKATGWELPGQPEHDSQTHAANGACVRCRDGQSRRAARLSLAHRRGFRLGVIHHGCCLSRLE